MYPSRPAPAAPKHASLPPNHPFATYFVPPFHSAGSSTTVSTCPSSASPSSSRCLQRPTSPPGSPLACRSTGARSYTTPHPSSLTHKPTSSPLPTDLALFDHRSKQNLLGDIEIILGKRLTFPFIEKLKSRREKKGTQKRGENTMRDHRWEKEVAWDGVRLAEKPTMSRRATTEGEWI